MSQTLPQRAPFALLIAVFLCLPFSTLKAQFGTAQILLPAQPLPKLEAVDIDGDGDLDLMGHFDDLAFQWAQNNDGLGALAAFTILVDAPGATTHVFGDVDSDGLGDIVYVDASNTVKLALNLGGGTFALPVVIETLAGPAGRITLADVSGNGSPEIVVTVTSVDNSRIAIIPNSGGVFGSMFLLSLQIDGDPPTILLAGDLNGNSGTDLVIVNDANAAIGVMNVNGDGSEWQPLVLFHMFDYPFVDPILIDVNGDGDLDIAEANSTVVQWADNRIDENIPFNAFTLRVIEPLMTAGIGAFGHLGCGDGASVIYIPSNPQLPVRWSTYLPETQRFSPRQELMGIPRGTTILLADMNGDGKPDLLIGNDTGLLLFENEIVAPTTLVQAPVLDTVCVSGPSIPLPDGLPAGGTWSGTWVVDDIFHRASVGGTSTVPLAYTWHEPNGCPIGAATSIRVISGPTIQPFFSSVICSGDGPFQMTSTPQATEWSGLSDGNILDLDQYNGEQIVAAYTDVTGATCVSFMGPLNVWSTISATILPAGPFCITDDIQTIEPELAWANSTWGGNISGTSGGNALFDPSQGAGTYTITLERSPTGPQQCANSDSITIVVTDDIPEVTLTQPDAYCASTSAIDLEFAEPAGGEWSGPGVTGDVLLPFIAGPGTHVLTYTYQEMGGCSITAETTITLASSVMVTTDHTGGYDLCIDEEPILFEAVPEGGVWSSPVSEQGIFDPELAGVGEHQLVYVYTDPNGCMLVNPPTTISVNEEPTDVMIDPIVGTICLTDAPFEIFGEPGGIWSGSVSGEGSTVLFDPAALGVGTWMVSLTATQEGFCPGTSTIDVEVEICTGLLQLADVPSIYLAPNPTTGMCWLELDGSVPAQIELLDATGKRVPGIEIMTATALTIPLDLSGLANGIYHLRVLQGDRIHQLKVLKTD